MRDGDTFTHDLIDEIEGQLGFRSTRTGGRTVYGRLSRLRDRLDGHPLTFDQLRRTNVMRCESAFHAVDDWSLTDWLTCVAGEVGELAAEVEPYPLLHPLMVRVSRATGDLASAIKNVRRRQTEGTSAHIIKDEGARERIAAESADVVIYLDLLLARIGLSLGAAVHGKFNEVSDRVGSLVKL